ncbi:MAG: hypothetical protein J0L95_13605 [Candidatus Accumulibacter sp.]|jgi:thymidylate kinase|uniref:hypothetical protein n=1 Tax=Accumulibacter sp. TaxID=2053492 RepID=UPI001AC737EE|nr:hypothetical protein [Accumulibacter sp.]MBN8439061.1 hypothetical protein [Accumulibacter sp.]
MESILGQKSTTPESIFLNILFDEFSSQGVRYAVMRNHDLLPFSAGGSDLDIIVAAEDGELTKALVLRSIQLAAGAPIGIAESIGFFKVYALGSAENYSYPWWGLRVDVNVGLFYKGHQLIAEGVHLPIRMNRNIAVLSDELSGVLGVLKEVINNGTYPVRYSKFAKIAALTEWTYIEMVLAPMGKRALTLLKTMMLTATCNDKLHRECREVRAAIFSQLFSRRAILSSLERLQFEWSKIHRYLRPSGVWVAILGVDGSGKSSVINAILPALNAATHNSVVLRHLRPALLPPIARLKGRKSLQVGPVLEPHGSTPSGKLGSIFRLAYLTLDYLAGYWLWTRVKIAKEPTVVIFDRYAYDMAIDPRRFRIGLPSWIAGWFVSLAPRPDLIICLQGNPEVIAARKRELSVEETRRQVDALRVFANSEPRAVLISTDTSIEETRDRVLHAIVDYIQAKHQYNY